MNIISDFEYINIYVDCDLSYKKYYSRYYLLEVC